MSNEINTNKTIKSFIKEWSDSHENHDDGCIDIYINNKLIEADLISDWYLGRLMRFKYRNAVVDKVTHGEYKGLSAGPYITIFATV